MGNSVGRKRGGAKDVDLKERRGEVEPTTD